MKDGDAVFICTAAAVATAIIIAIFYAGWLYVTTK